MPVSLDILRLVEMSLELRAMGSRGIQRKRLGSIALDILLSKAAASHIANRSGQRNQKEWAKRALGMLARLEAETVRLYSNSLAHTRLVHRLHGGIALAAVNR